MTPRNGGRIPSLDGIRALSISIVLLSHSYGTLANERVRETLKYIFLFEGQLGVTTFFILSGFLITTLILNEKRETDSINLVGFYKRRAFRILPPYYVFLGILFLLSELGSIPPNWKPYMLIAAALFGTDYYYRVGWLGHTWSLSIEEHYYLIWPLLMKKLSMRQLKRFVLISMVVVPFFRVATWNLSFLKTAPFYNSFFMFHNRIDGIMLGCAAALFYSDPKFLHWKKHLFSPYTQLLALACLSLDPLFEAKYKGLWFTVVLPLEQIAICVMMLWLIEHPGGRIGKVFNSRPVVHLGVISYSLYIWQQLFCRPINSFFVGTLPWSILFSLIAAELSYHLIEQPVLRWRNRHMSQDRKDVKSPLRAAAGEN
jgi:peptidoglycan/LPS O-acetylase OafA/YrhL